MPTKSDDDQKPRERLKKRAEHHAELLAGLANQRRDTGDHHQLVFIDLARVIELTGRSKSAIYEDPTFPLPVSFSEPSRARRQARWLLHEVEAWLQARIAERDAKAPQRRQELIVQRERRLAKQRLAPKRGAAEVDA